MRPLKLDVTQANDREAAVKFIQENFGKLDILVNNAGIAEEGGWGKNTTSGTSAETLKKTFETNLFAPVALTQALLPLIRKSPAGRIVNLSSILASNTLHSDPKSPIYNSKAFAYDASKSALNAFSIHSGARTARHQYQGQFRASGMGENGYGHRRRSHGNCGWSENFCCVGNPRTRWADRSFHSPGKTAALVICQDFVEMKNEKARESRAFSRAMKRF